jgi:hypothetical protein
MGSLPKCFSCTVIKSRTEGTNPLCSMLCNLFILFSITLDMGALPQKWIFACADCGCIFTTMAEKQTGICPLCKSSDRNMIEGFNY